MATVDGAGGGGLGGGGGGWSNGGGWGGGWAGGGGWYGGKDWHGGGDGGGGDDKTLAFTESWYKDLRVCNKCGRKTYLTMLSSA